MSKKSVIKKEKPVKKPSKKVSDPVVALLVDNFVNLQKNFTTLTEKFNSLSSQISSLLRLFEISAKSIAEKPELGFEKEFLDKVNALLEQNKVIAKALSIIEERTRHPSMPVSAPMPSMPMPTPKPAMPPTMRPAPGMPAMPPRATPQSSPAPSEEYTASSMEKRAKPLPSG